MELIKADIDDAIKSAKKYQDFVNILAYKGYYIKKSGYSISESTPYYNRNIRLARAFGEEYTFDNIKYRIYYNKTYPLCEQNKKVYKVNVYDGIKIDPIKLKLSSFYRHYVHYLYVLGKLPPKVHYEERTPEYYKELDKFKKLCDELNMISNGDLKSAEDTQNLKSKYLNEVAPLKAEREKLRILYNKTRSDTDKRIIEAKINVITEDIDRFNSKIQTCRRIIKKAEKGEKEDCLIKGRLEDNRVKNEQKMDKNVDKKRIR